MCSEIKCLLVQKVRNVSRAWNLKNFKNVWTNTLLGWDHAAINQPFWTCKYITEISITSTWVHYDNILVSSNSHSFRHASLWIHLLCFQQRRFLNFSTHPPFLLFINRLFFSRGFAKLSVLRTSLSFVYRSITHKNSHASWLGCWPVEIFTTIISFI